MPLRSNRNLVKFHLMSPPICGFTDFSVKKVERRFIFTQHTDLGIMGKVMSYMLWQNVLISAR